MDLEMIVFGEYTLRQCLYALGGLITVVIIFKILKKLLFPPKANLQHSTAYTCPDCGWKGHIGKYAQSCPKCSRPVD